MRHIILLLCLGFGTNSYCKGADNIPMIDSLINHSIEKKMFSGSVLVTKNNKVIYQKTYGLANAESSRVIDQKTSFNLSSLTRTLTTSCVLKLADQGKLNLGDEMRKFIPEYPFDGVTIKSFLQQNEGNNNEVQLRCSGNSAGNLSNYKARNDAYNGEGTLLDNKCDFTNYNCSKEKYLNDNYLMLAQIVEKASGETFKNYVHKNILTPCAMDNTYVNNVDTFTNKAIGYRYSYFTEQFTPYTNTFLEPADANIYSNCNDLLNFTNNYFSGKLISNEMVKEATTSDNFIRANRSIYGGISLILLGFCLLSRPSKKGFLALAAISMIGGMTLTWSGFYNKKSEFRDFAMGWEKMIYNKEEVTYQTGNTGGAKNILWHENSGLNIIILSNSTTCPNYALAKGISNIVHDQPHQVPSSPLAYIYCENLRKSSDITETLRKTKQEWLKKDYVDSKYNEEEEKINELANELKSINKIPESIAAFNLGDLLQNKNLAKTDTYSDVLTRSGNTLNSMFSITNEENRVKLPENVRSQKMDNPIEN